MSFHKILIVSSILLLSGCVKEHYHHGYGFNQNSLELIKVGVSTEEEVLEQLGSPTSTSNFGDKTYYYISSTTEKIAFLKPQIIEQNVLSIQFANNGKVSQITNFTLDDANQVTFSKNETEIRGNSLNPVEQILSNLGKFNKKQNQF